MSTHVPQTKLAPWHAGEKALQETAGVSDRMEDVGRRVIRDFMPEQHREFYSRVPFVVVGAVDHAGAPWATLLAGEPGFMRSPTDKSLNISARREASDPASEGLAEGDAIGLLGIELHTRRRNRMNGVIATASPAELRVEVDQSFGNCPQYIQLRDYSFVRDPKSPAPVLVEESDTLDAEARAMIAGADTFYVASYAERDDRRQVDVSHRGGRAGFVRVGDDGVLTVPDFAGNLFFATLGNILLNGKAGLVFIDFESGDLLQMTGEAEVVLDSPEIAAFQGAERLWTFRPRRVVRRRNALPLRWAFEANGWSPNALMTGDWTQTADRLKAAELKARWRPFKVSRIVDESRTIRSFYLEPDDGAGLPAHQAGQHLPIRLTLPGADKPVIRTYTLSVAPSDGIYRISVKRDGAVSQHLHDHVRVGDVLEVRAPDGAFTIDPDAERLAVMLGAGVGVTPLIAMLRHLVHEGLRTRHIRPTVFFYRAHSKADRAFDAELAELAAAAEGAVTIIRLLSDTDGAQAGIDFEAEGRLDLARLSRHLRPGDYDYYLCGPSPFIQTLYDGLREDEVPDERIHTEAFGPSSLKRATRMGGPPPAATPVAVIFTESLKEARWTPGPQTLLELAEARGLDPEYSCRIGSCGTCRTKLVKGAVSYLTPPTAPIGDGEVLICCAAPAASGDEAAPRIELAL
ncbi:FAD-binding oxidoreductase [Caulobacter sp. Root656]|nr:FAD-binding oxidoreductase [Caulobacter sp. Root656]